MLARSAGFTIARTWTDPAAVRLSSYLSQSP
jgi:hypothetical protein